MYISAGSMIKNIWRGTIGSFRGLILKLLILEEKSRRFTGETFLGEGYTINVGGDGYPSNYGTTCPSTCERRIGIPDRLN